MRLSFGLPSCTCEGRKTGGLDVVSFWQTQWLGCREHEALVLDIRPTCCYLRISRRSSSCMPRRRHANTPEGEDEEGEQIELHSIRHTNGWQTGVCDRLLTTMSSRCKPIPFHQPIKPGRHTSTCAARVVLHMRRQLRQHRERLPSLSLSSHDTWTLHPCLCLHYTYLLTPRTITPTTPPSASSSHRTKRHRAPPRTIWVLLRMMMPISS